MKKILTLLLVLSIFLVGCTMNKNKETPSEKVANYLDSYNKLDDNVLTDLDNLVDNMGDYNSNQQERYKKLMKKHYKDLKYKIKSENIEEDQAVVEVEIEVYDYSGIMNGSVMEEDFTDEDGNYDMNKYNDYQLDLLENVNNKVKYTIIFNLTKQDGNWVLEDPNDTIIQKIHGIYAY